MAASKTHTLTTLGLGLAIGAGSTLGVQYLVNRENNDSYEDGRAKGLAILPPLIGDLLSRFSDTTSSISTAEKPVVLYRDPVSLEADMDKDWVHHEHNPDGSSALSLNESGLDVYGQEGSLTLASLLQLVCDYCVDTGNDMFFNQLYGKMDPAAVAGELVSLFMNTNQFTYESSPVFAMMESEVLKSTTSLLGWKWPDCDGQMAAGGSLANMTAIHIARHHMFPKTREGGNAAFPSTAVCYVSEEAHYSFLKMVGVVGLGRNNLIKIKSVGKGQMCAKDLVAQIAKTKASGGTPFFVGCTAGSTVKGTFDKFDEIADICKKFNLWMHVDGAWGGPALFSERPEMKELCKGVSRADSVTLNPHKMLGTPLTTTVFMTRHKGLLLKTNSANAGYLFDKRKNGAAFDKGDGSFMCGRKCDAVKVWSMWKFRGRKGLAARVDRNADNLRLLAKKIRQHDHFMLACDPWPFNVNFLYLPKRVRAMMEEAGIATDGSEANIVFPDHIAEALSTVAIDLKLRLQEKGLALLPYQPLVGQKAQVFRVILAGAKDDWGEAEIDELMDNLVEYGDEL